MMPTLPPLSIWFNSAYPFIPGSDAHQLFILVKL